MEIFRGFLCFSISLLTFHFFLPVSIAQLSPSETRILFQVQQILEYPEVLWGWTNWTNFCYLPPNPSLSIVCSDSHITELTVTGNRTSPSHLQKPTSGKPLVSRQTLSDKFSIDSLFTILTKLSSLKVLSLVSLGLWGPLPAKINRLNSLEVLNISSNFIYGEVPASITTMKNLKSLVLSDNLFNGSVPDLRGLQGLQELDFSNNRLGPKFPSLGNNLMIVVLRNNSLRSEIPSKIEDFDLLQRLDVSSNKLIGPIPANLFGLPSIEYVNLADNQFSGALSTNVSCNANLSFVDVSKNLLIGKLPVCIGSNSRNRTVLSWWNCLGNGSLKYQHPYRFCHKEALAVKPPVRGREGQSAMKLGLILGIIGGIIGAVGIFGLLVLVILRKSNRNEADNFNCDSFVFNKTSARGSPIIDGRHVPRSIRVPAIGLPPYHVFTLEEMEDVTNNFDPSNLVKEVSQGQLYKARLRDGSMALVKCLKLKQKHSYQNLQQQMEMISKLRHHHLVSVLGHCIVTFQDQPSNTATTVLIVLEHVANGSLRDHLTDWKKREYLKWPQRMGITTGIAKGIQFLHTGIVPGVFGNDLKIENILLDDSLNAKINSYNISLPSKVGGSESPLSSQDASNRHGSIENAEKNDIYQLGVILLEAITGKPITSESELDDLKLQLERTLSESPSRLKELIDPSIRGTFAYDSIKTAVEITLKCLGKDSSARPTIEDVLWHLQYSIQVQEGWTSSGNLSTKL
ncbi:LRR receptor-like serine/threonine-protein kinase precursor [Actinidia chinensis var. chinensis]|uniref:non-specific serine/threonine protein kinase n=1 Tax=Actinidia chinensis var. chinensis TaxID=1590841 RepID=A0A2R6RFD3_ACTCC|nr:LRR receptor-like serine/threonine-protein kinase precursor [Actinidia chinensis var. chinensis]